VEDLQAQLLSRHVMEGQQLLMNNDLSDASLLNLTYDQVSLTCYMLCCNNNLCYKMSMYVYYEDWDVAK